MNISPDKPFFLFGMGNREKLFYQSGKLTSVASGEVLFSSGYSRETITPEAYSVTLLTPSGEVTILEDETSVRILSRDGERVLSSSPLSLLSFEDHPCRACMRILQHDILINVINGKPVPNFFVYQKPWYRDGAMMAMVLEKTGNLSLIRDWAASLTELYDRNNAGCEESDNLGQLLFILAKAGLSEHPLVEKTIEEAKRRMKSGALTGLSDFEEHPVYQTKWLKLGLEALGCDTSWVKIPDVQDSYAALFWMDGHREEPIEEPYNDYYPYLSWAKAHTCGFTMDKTRLEALSHPVYPISSETNASQAKYELLRPWLPAYADARHAAPHTWHAAEMFLYLADQFGL
ncbi:MAG: hypothetical protein MJ141_01655 [Clostridia bacterium]|nr:hypothetical protein [Clostridia bacterium]